MYGSGILGDSKMSRAEPADLALRSRRHEPPLMPNSD